MIVSTHQLAELANVVNHLVVLHRGRVVHQGLASEVASPGASLEDAVFDLLSDLDTSGEVAA